MALVKKYIKENIGIVVLCTILSVLGWSAVTGIHVVMQQIIDTIVEGNNERFIVVLVIGFIYVVIARILFLFAALVPQKLYVKVDENLRRDLIDSILKRNELDFNARDTAEYMSLLTNDVTSFKSIFQMGTWLLTGIIGVFTPITLMLVHSPLLSIIAIICSCFGIVLPILFTKAMKLRQKTRMEAQSEFTVSSKEILSGRNVIVSFNLIDLFLKRFAKYNSFLADSEYKTRALENINVNTGYGLTDVSKIIMALFSGIMIFNGHITIGVLILFVSLQTSLSSNLVLIMQVIPMIRGIQPIIEKINSFLNYENNENIGNVTAKLERGVTVKDLSFNYKDNIAVISNFNFYANKNEKIVLIGPSGSGKTTLLKLICGVYTGFAGNISYDGVPISELSQVSLRKLVTVVHQHTFIFNETIRFNICLGEDFADKELNNALNKSGVQNFLSSIENGIDGYCGENGSSLSGGQKQRIALARALIRKSKFIILDEGVSAVDVETANEIEQELLNIEDLTLITVTHRIKDGLVDRYDRIVNINN